MKQSAQIIEYLQKNTKHYTVTAQNHTLTAKNHRQLAQNPTQIPLENERMGFKSKKENFEPFFKFFHKKMANCTYIFDAMYIYIQL